MAQNLLPHLLEAQRTKRFVRLSRRFEETPIRGYVLDIGPAFFLLALVSDRIRFDGFECFRPRDLREIMADPHAAFAETALQLRRERLPKKPRVSVASIEELLLTASRSFPLVTIHRESVDPSVCWIGRVLAIEHGRVSLLEINPDATWEETPCSYPLKEITRINFGGDYEDALHLVAAQSGPHVKSKKELLRKATAAGKR